MTTKILTRLPLLALVLAALIPGCGGGQSSSPATGAASGRGTARFTIMFPATTSRDIPAATQSVILSITGDGLKAPVRMVVNRPAFTTAQSVSVQELLPVGAKTFIAVARAAADGAGSTLASGTAAGTIEENKTSSVDITLQPGTLLMRKDPPTIVLQDVPKAKGATLTATGATFPYPQTTGFGLGAYSFTWSPPPATIHAGDTVDFTITASAGGSPSSLQVSCCSYPVSYAADVINDNGSAPVPDLTTSAEVAYNLDGCFNGSQAISPCTTPLVVRNVTRHIPTSDNASLNVTVVIDYPSHYATVSWLYLPVNP